MRRKAMLLLELSNVRSCFCADFGCDLCSVDDLCAHDSSNVRCISWLRENCTTSWALGIRQGKEDIVRAQVSPNHRHSREIRSNTLIPRSVTGGARKFDIFDMAGHVKCGENS